MFACSVYAPDTPKTDGRRQQSLDRGVSDPGLDEPVSKSALANEDGGSRLDLGLRVEDGKSIGFGHSAKIYEGDEDAWTGAVPVDSHRTTRCESRTPTSC